MRSDSAMDAALQAMMDENSDDDDDEMELLECAKEFSEDLGLWDVSACESMQEMFWVRLPRAPCTEWSLPAHRRISR